MLPNLLKTRPASQAPGLTHRDLTLETERGTLSSQFQGRRRVSNYQVPSTTPATLQGRSPMDGVLRRDTAPCRTCPQKRESEQVSSDGTGIFKCETGKPLSLHRLERE
jgi:hypothetical protein